jgi:hypothetical protein
MISLFSSDSPATSLKKEFSLVDSETLKKKHLLVTTINKTISFNFYLNHKNYTFLEILSC